MTCWDAAGEATVRPASIIEWKHNESDVSAHDVEWLAEFSTGVEDFVGYAVCTNLRGARNSRLSCTRLHKGQSQPRWLFLECGANRRRARLPRDPQADPGTADHTEKLI